jgi:8-oxo-dGTP diphosphatase
VKREIFEESGIRIENPELKGIILFPDFKGEDWLVFVYIAYTEEESFKESKEGSLKWIKDEDVFKLDLWEGDRIFIKWLKEDRFFSAKFTYIDDRLIDHQVVFYNDKN